MIKIKSEQSISTVRKKKYCDHKCYSNSTIKSYKTKKEYKCTKCKIVHLSSTGNRRYCESCLKIIKEKNLKYRKTLDLNQNKASFFNKSKSWQSARSQIQKNARKIYFASDKPKICMRCGYNKHVEVCHIKAVSEFSDNSLLAEINDINNFLALCPNHHWEFDNGYLSIEEILK